MRGKLMSKTQYAANSWKMGLKTILSGNLEVFSWDSDDNGVAVKKEAGDFVISHHCYQMQRVGFLRH